MENTIEIYQEEKELRGNAWQPMQNRFRKRYRRIQSRL